MAKKKAKLPLAKTHPKLSKEADGWNPSLYYSNSAKRMKWKCRRGHKWEQLIRSRTNRGIPNYLNPCPVCNSLAGKFPKIAKEADGWDPRSISAKNNKKLKWKCPKGHKYKAMVYNRTNGSECPICLGRIVLSGYNDLKTTHPELAKEVDGWSPKSYTQGSSKKMKWKCAKGHKWMAVISSRSQGNNCPVCGFAKVLKGFNDLKTTHPELAKEADGWDPTQVRAGSSQNVRWKCSFNHLWTANINNRSRGRGCPICSGLTVLKGFNDLKTTHPKLAKEADGWDPSEIIAGTTKNLRWRCSKGHKWETTGSSRVRGNKGKGSNCPVCSNQKVLPGFNDLKTTHPEIAKFAEGWDPTKIVAGSTRIVTWTCKNKHRWKASVSRRTKNKNCAYCSGDLLWKGFNDLKTTHPKIAIEAHKWDTSNLMAGSRKKVKWKCLNGHIWSTSVYIRTRKMRPSNCPTCAPSGFDTNMHAWFYLLEHPDWDLQQIGITNYPHERIGLHKGRGWVQLDLKGPMKGSQAREIETIILKKLKMNGAKIPPNSIKKFDGFTEAWSKSTFSVKSIKELMRLTEDFEEAQGR